MKSKTQKKLNALENSIKEISAEIEQLLQSRNKMAAGANSTKNIQVMDINTWLNDPKSPLCRLENAFVTYKKLFEKNSSLKNSSTFIELKCLYEKVVYKISLDLFALSRTLFAQLDELTNTNVIEKYLLLPMPKKISKYGADKNAIYVSQNDGYLEYRIFTADGELVHDKIESTLVDQFTHIEHFLENFSIKKLQPFLPNLLAHIQQKHKIIPLTPQSHKNNKNAMSNLTNLIIDDILSKSDLNLRTLVMYRCITLMKQSFEFEDYGTAIAISSALSNGAITRLHSTRAGLPPQAEEARAMLCDYIFLKPQRLKTLLENRDSDSFIPGFNCIINLLALASEFKDTDAMTEMVALLLTVQNAHQKHLSALAKDPLCEYTLKVITQNLEFFTKAVEDVDDFISRIDKRSKKLESNSKKSKVSKSTLLTNAYPDTLLMSKKKLRINPAANIQFRQNDINYEIRLLTDELTNYAKKHKKSGIVIFPIINAFNERKTNADKLRYLQTILENDEIRNHSLFGSIKKLLGIEPAAIEILNQIKTLLETQISLSRELYSLNRNSNLSRACSLAHLPQKAQAQPSQPNATAFIPPGSNNNAAPETVVSTAVIDMAPVQLKDSRLNSTSLQRSQSDFKPAKLRSAQTSEKSQHTFTQSRLSIIGLKPAKTTIQSKHSSIMMTTKPMVAENEFGFKKRSPSLSQVINHFENINKANTIANLTMKHRSISLGSFLKGTGPRVKEMVANIEKRNSLPSPLPKSPRRG